MIKRLHIQNVQSHEDSVLDFVPGVNVITGVTDSGKSAIMKSLRLVIENKPTGEDFISHWADEMKITLEVDEGEVIREKGKKNRYRLIVPGRDEMVFEGFGTEVPSEIAKLLNIQSINFQSQIDNHFLLSSTAGEVAKHFNRVAQLDMIDVSQAYIRSQINRIERDVENKKTQLKDYREQLQRFEGLDKLEMTLEVLEDMENRRNKLSRDKSRLTQMLIRLDRVEERIKYEGAIIRFENRVDKLLNIREQLQTLKRKQRQLRNDLNDLQRIDREQRKCKKYIKLDKSVRELLSKKETLANLVMSNKRLGNKLYKLLAVDKQLKRVSETLKIKETQFQREFPDECPLCGTPKKDIKL